MELSYFNYIPFDIVSIIVSNLDNVSLSKFLRGYNIKESIEWNHIYNLHFGSNKYYRIKLKYEKYLEHLDIEKLKEIFELKGETKEHISNIKIIEHNKIKVPSFAIAPKEINYLNGLTILELQKLGLENIDEIYNLKKLRRLDLSFNKIKEISDHIINLSSLGVLNFNNNNIKLISVNLYKLIELENLSLGNNIIEVISEDIMHLRNLESLNIGNNLIQLYPSNLDTFSNMRCLNINSIQRIKNIKFPFLQILDANNTFKKNIPKNILNLAQLSVLRLKNCQIDEITNELDSLSNLRNLYLSFNNIIKFQINLIYIQTLSLDHNKLDHFPISILNLRRLHTLVLSNNHIKFIPDNISNLTNLRFLDMKYNELSVLTSGISFLNNLSVLHVNHNKLEHLPLYMCGLGGLRHLSMSNNKIKRVIAPPNIKKLSIYNNPISDFSFLTRINNLIRLRIDKDQYHLLEKVENFNMSIVRIKK